jgi:Tol biopolymer transport system component
MKVNISLLACLCLALALCVSPTWVQAWNPIRPAEVGASGGVTVRVSVSSYGAQQANADSYAPSVSADGRVIAFHSIASNLVEGDTNGQRDVFVHDRETNLTTRASISSTGVQGNGASGYPSISADGRYVAFHSAASNLVEGDTNGYTDAFVHDRVTRQTTRVSVNSGGAQAIMGHSEYPSISGDGRYVAFHSDATNLVDGDTNFTHDIFVRDRELSQTRRVSVNSLGAQSGSRSRFPAIAANAPEVAFVSEASNLVEGDSNGVADIFVHNWQTGATTRVSINDAREQGNAASGAPSISADGRHVAFHSDSTNLTPEDYGGRRDVFVRNQDSQRTQCASMSSTLVMGNGDSESPSISADGRYVTFESAANNLAPGDTNNQRDVFLRDLVTMITVRVSIDTSGAQSNGSNTYARISGDGVYVAFQSGASNLISNDTNGAWDVFIHAHLMPRAMLPIVWRNRVGP